ncbi:lipid-binding SYLF domain-containing protein [Pediococcus acidilactici]|uniref:Uncharacterized protein n=1 Tax=Pediococcus acidilactici DSM 20284 TaxID=862514 RepID=E0NH39_PEDAC|nr:hypothetical protein [Pediococcus acidilactici]AZP89853.1 hypothetical protein CYD95_00205 [Pediococcus acidilactici]EFL95226.1 hypothetical protein HMPREF0623_1362 [Pediococcus acidilactici DSM 20284]MDG9738915.1 hypothetical protein [Pediococcus acidilactici]NKZ16465.1 hypothetical protein [Pediococcus acidilactici]QQT95313.1 hypothetical protein I6I90_06275 [Pediococcus acidilactici]
MHMGFKKYFSNGTDRKADNYPMVKRNRRWILASALMLAMFGAGVVQSHASAKAATINAPRTETTTKAAEYTKAPRQGRSRGIAIFQNLDKTKTVATQKTNLTNALEKGNLNITGGAYYGLLKNGDGTYSGGLQFNYSGSGSNKFDFANLVIRVPEPLRGLFKKINESGRWTKYFNGNGSINNGPLGMMWTYTNEDFSYDGTNLILNVGDASLEYGSKTTTAFLNFNLGQAVTDFEEEIPDTTDYYLFKMALVDPESPINWDLIGDYAGSDELGTNHIMYR